MIWINEPSVVLFLVVRKKKKKKTRHNNIQMVDSDEYKKDMLTWLSFLLAFR